MAEVPGLVLEPATLVRHSGRRSATRSAPASARRTPPTYSDATLAPRTFRAAPHPAARRALQKWRAHAPAKPPRALLRRRHGKRTLRPRPNAAATTRPS